MSTVLVALVLVPIALVLVAGLVGLLARPLITPGLAMIERGRFQRRLARAARGDAHLHAHHVEAALRELESAFCLMTVRSDPRLLDQIGRHHVGLLSRLLSVADDLPQHMRRNVLADRSGSSCIAERLTSNARTQMGALSRRE